MSTLLRDSRTNLNDINHFMCLSYAAKHTGDMVCSCLNVGPWWCKANPLIYQGVQVCPKCVQSVQRCPKVSKVSKVNTPKVNLISLLAPRSGHATTIKVCRRLIEDFSNEFARCIWWEDLSLRMLFLKKFCDLWFLWFFCISFAITHPSLFSYVHY